MKSPTVVASAIVAVRQCRALARQMRQMRRRRRTTKVQLYRLGFGDSLMFADRLLYTQPYD